MRGVVVCPEPPAAEAGRSILARGGNAVDAAVAAAFAQGVANPLGCGIGGHAAIQIYSATDDVSLYLDALVSVGSGSDPSRFVRDLTGRSERVGRYLLKGDPNQLGHSSIMIPGFVAGMGELAARFGSGRVSWADIVSPAADLAAEGFAIYPYLATYYTFEGPDRPGYPDVFRKLASNPRAAALYLPGGSVPHEGHVLIQEELAGTLRRLAHGGAHEYYTGGVGREIAEDLRAGGGPVTAADLASYTVRTQMPLTMAWRGLVLHTSTPPTRGALLLAMLRSVEHVDLAALGVNSPAYVDLLARVTSRAFADGARVLADPVFASVPLEHLLSRDRVQRTSAHTTHVTTADGDGNMVAITHSIGSVTGSGVTSPGLGFFYNNFLGFFNPMPGHHDSMVPGKRAGGACPTIVFKDGRPVLAIGSSGGSRLVSAVFQTLLNVFVHGMDPQEAVTAPRFHCEQDGVLYVEPTFPSDTVASLRRIGRELVTTAYMGCNQAIMFDGDTVRSGGDPRGGMGIAVV